MVEQAVKINTSTLYDKIYACFLGKNIGGTMGAPFEGRVDDDLNVTGFTSAPGEPLPNDDLDLQLAWLRAVEEVGAAALTANDLTWYWMRLIYPDWNEYGIAKNNLKMGFLPPMSGELNNGAWRNSNGAWIRSEIWACLAPGCPELAVKYAIMDASIDHGVGEGTVAEIFTAALESMAFVESDIRCVLNFALSCIPEDSRVAKSVRLVLDGYDSGTPWRELRRQVMQANADWGNFQAPSNLAFVAIGLLYGHGDMKESLLIAINCGDDTDCTAATVGAVHGILHGMAGIPQELSEYIGDKIVTMSIDRSFDFGKRIPETCTELCNRIMRQIPGVFLAHRIVPNTLAGAVGEPLFDGDLPHPPPTPPDYPVTAPMLARDFLALPPYSFQVGNHALSATVHYGGEPYLTLNSPLTVTVDFQNFEYDPQWLKITVHTPAGVNAAYQKSLCVLHPSTCSSRERGLGHTTGKASFALTLSTDVPVEAHTYIPVTVEILGYPTPLTIPIVVLG